MKLEGLSDTIDGCSIQDTLFSSTDVIQDIKRFILDCVST